MFSGDTNGCFSMNYNLEKMLNLNSFNFNYNPNTNSAMNSLNLGVNGITCSNCYSYVGVYIFLIFEYWDTYAEMAFEAKLDGGVGVRTS